MCALVVADLHAPLGFSETTELELENSSSVEPPSALASDRRGLWGPRGIVD